MEPRNLICFPINTCDYHKCTSHRHSLPTLCHTVQSILSDYTNTIMKISTAEMSSIRIHIAFTSLHNFLFSLESVIFILVGFFNVLSFLGTYHWVIPELYPSSLKFLARVCTYQVWQQSHLGNTCLEAALTWSAQLRPRDLSSTRRRASHHLSWELEKHLLGRSLTHCCWEVQGVLTPDPPEVTYFSL